MAEERKQISRVWLWFGACVVLVIVFFVARTLTRDRIPIHAAKAIRVELVNTTVQGGTLNDTAKGTLETVGSAELDGSTLPSSSQTRIPLVDDGSLHTVRLLLGGADSCHRS